MTQESAFSMDTSSIKYGPGVTREIGWDMEEQGARRVMVVTDPNLAESEPVAVTLEALRQNGIDAVLFDQVHVEPTDLSFKEAIKFAEDGKFDGFVAVGGGSSMDTAKAANLYSTYPADFMTYVNPPIGKGVPVPGKLKPLVAVPTTAGTGSETTGVAIFDLVEMKAKTGIAHRALRPEKGIIDPNNTASMPRMVTACTGLDQLTHALESLTALPFSQRPAPEHPRLRPAYQGSNPISHIWASAAAEMISKNLVKVVENPSDVEARGQVLLAATYAGIGFGNGGVHLAHGMSYPVSGMAWHVIPGIRHGSRLCTGRLSARTAACPPRDGGGSQCTGGIPIYRFSQSGLASVRGATDGQRHFERQARGSRRNSIRCDYRIDAESRDAQRTERIGFWSG
jgi:hydroxyacid-oxoacid transhydrogenase